MDMGRGMNHPLDSDMGTGTDDAVVDRPPDVGTDERRMHVRAYNHWVSLLHGRAYPAINDLDPGRIADFGPNSVLLDFTEGVEDPSIRYLGGALRAECGVMPSIQRVAEVPSRSLLSRLTDHYLQIIANRAPIGFEAEFVGRRGHNTLYRGILMPFSSNGDTIDFIYGVINWKELVDDETAARLHGELEESRRVAPQPAASAPVWADGPSGSFDAPADIQEPTAHADLADRLMLARESAAAARASDTRSRAALYRALARAYDFARATEAEGEKYAKLLDEAGLKPQARAPMTPAAKLVFGKEYDKTRLTEFAAVLTHAKRKGVQPGELEALLDATEGGIKGIVAAERAERRAANASPASAVTRAADELRSRRPLGHVAIDSQPGELVLLVGRAGQSGVDILAMVEDAGLIERAVRKAAA